MPARRRKRSRADVVHDHLRHMIVTLELPPKAPLSEKELCERFDVSRTPLREAILRLAEHGMVIVAPQHGTFVSGISPRAVRLAHFLRVNLEVPMIRRLAQQPSPDLGPATALLMEQKILAARNDQAGFIQRDDAFHEALFEAAGLPGLWGVIQARKGHLDRIRFVQGNARGSVSVPLSQHVAILDAVRDGAISLAEDLMADHVAGSLDFMERQLREHPEMFDPENEADEAMATNPSILQRHQET